MLAMSHPISSDLYSNLSTALIGPGYNKEELHSTKKANKTPRFMWQVQRIRCAAKKNALKNYKKLVWHLGTQTPALLVNYFSKGFGKKKIMLKRIQPWSQTMFLCDEVTWGCICFYLEVFWNSWDWTKAKIISLCPRKRKKRAVQELQLSNLCEFIKVRQSA